MRDYVIPLLVALALFGMKSEINSLKKSLEVCHGASERGY